MGEPQLFQYFKTVFFEIQNVKTWSIFVNPVTYVFLKGFTYCSLGKIQCKKIFCQKLGTMKIKHMKFS